MLHDSCHIRIDDPVRENLKGQREQKGDVWDRVANKGLFDAYCLVQ